MDKSEFNTKPVKIIISDPKTYGALDKVNWGNLEKYNFIEVPDVSSLYDQYDAFVDKIHELGVQTEELGNIVDNLGESSFDHLNPNLMFTRDSAITLPWAPTSYIPARFALPSRQDESLIMANALGNLGLEPIIHLEADEYLEGGDVLPVVHDGMRTLIIGFGARTTQSAALKLANKLIPSYIDQIIGLRHDANVLHLDTGFTVLPRQVILAAKGMFNNGFVIDKNKQLSEVDPIAFAESLGFNIIRTTISEAVKYERCNMLPIGDNNYIAFRMPEQLKQQLQDASHIWIHEVDGDEISKATGGVHCLTRPIYL